jgi:hypothetical protein
MAKVELSVPHRLITDKIDSIVKGTFPGVYILGDYDGRRFIPKSIGRANSDLMVKIMEIAGERESNGFMPCHFKFAAAKSAQAAFEMECALHHKLKNKLKDAEHPKPSKGMDWKCLECPRSVQ